MINQIIKRILIVLSVIAICNVIIWGLHIMFNSNVGLPDSEKWKYMISNCISALLLQYVAFKFFDKDVQKKSK